MQTSRELPWLMREQNLPLEHSQMAKYTNCQHTKPSKETVSKEVNSSKVNLSKDEEGAKIGLRLDQGGKTPRTESLSARDAERTTHMANAQPMTKTVQNVAREVTMPRNVAYGKTSRKWEHFK